MRETMLILHLLGLVMGVGTSFAFLFLGRVAAKMEKEAANNFMLNSYSIGTMGHIGLTLSIISGGYLMTPFWSILGHQPLLMAKLILVVVLLVIISIISVKARKAKQGDTDHILGQIKNWGKVSFLVSLAIVILAVLSFR